MNKELDNSLIGQIVLFHLSIDPMGDAVPIDIVMKVTKMRVRIVEGKFIAGDTCTSYFAGSSLYPHDSQLYPQPELDSYNLLTTLIDSYRILIIKELPLLVGMKYKSDLLAKLIKDGI